MMDVKVHVNFVRNKMVHADPLAVNPFWWLAKGAQVPTFEKWTCFHYLTSLVFRFPFVPTVFCLKEPTKWKSWYPFVAWIPDTPKVPCYNSLRGFCGIEYIPSPLKPPPNYFPISGDFLFLFSVAILAWGFEIFQGYLHFLV